MNAIIYFLFSFLSLNAETISPKHPTAMEPNMNLTCIQKFLTNYANINSYKVKIHKQEYNFDGTARESATLILDHKKPLFTKITFLNEGVTGIRNNGMEIEYDGLGDYIRIRPGSSKGFGKVISAPVRMALGGGLKLTDPLVLKNEHFTLNRISFSYLSYLFTENMKLLESGKFGRYKYVDRPCVLKYEPVLNASREINLEISDSIFKLEEKYATLSFFILANNLSKFSSLNDLFHRRQPQRVSIPLSFMAHEISFDEKTFLPSRLTFKKEDRVLADYTYEIIFFSN